jgi:hypothetical protein
MSVDKMARSWWHTIPGVITAIAALITTADGKQVRGSTDSGCGFIGLSDLGGFEIYAEQLDLLEFKR